MMMNGKEEHEERAKVVAILELALKALPEPDHTGELVKSATGAIVVAPLESNDCACAPHQAHKAVRSALAQIKDHQCFHCTNFDPAAGPVGARLEP